MYPHTHSDARTHTNTITAGYIGKHPPQYKSCLRVAAVWGLYFLEHCLTVYISAGVCFCVCVSACMYVRAGGRDETLAL